jgi:hypothetical protein
MIKQYEKVRVVSERLIDDGVPRGALGYVVEIYGPEARPATVIHPIVGYEVDFCEPTIPGALSGFIRTTSNQPPGPSREASVGHPR